MNMTTLREKSKIFIIIVLSGFLLSLVGIMGSAGGGFLGGASMTSFFSTTLNTNLYVGKVGDNKITRNEFSIELQNQRNTNQFQINATESFYIGSAWNAIIRNTITDEKIKDLNLQTQNNELKKFLYFSPPAILQNFLIDSTQNNVGSFFRSEDGKFDLEEYQFSIDNNLNWMPAELISSIARYENTLKKDYLPVEKLRNLYSKLVSVSNAHVNESIVNSNTNCNIDILSIEYSKIEDSLINISQSDIEEYYNDNKEDKFLAKETVLLDYIIFENIENEDDSLEIMLNEDQKQLSIDFSLDSQPGIMTFNEAIQSYNLQIKDTVRITEDFSNNSGIPLNMGYDRRIVRFAFDNSNESVSDRIVTDNGNVIFHIISREKGEYQDMNEVVDEITKILVEEKKKELASSEIQLMLTNKSLINEIADNCTYCTLNENEESTISGSFKTTGKNYKIMGVLSAINEGETSKLIDSNNILYLLKLNKKYTFDTSTLTDEFDTSKDKIINNLSRSVYNSWINYMTEKIEKIDLRHKAI